MTQIRILLVDDHPLFRQGLRDVLDTEPDLHVIGEAANGDVAVDIAVTARPDIIFMDVNLPTENGLQVTKRIKKLIPTTRIIIVTAYDDAQQVYHALEAGASAYCSKDITPQALTSTVFKVFAGKYVIGEKDMSEGELKEWVHRTLGYKYGANIILEDMLVPLSPREMEILRLVTNGQSNKEIAHNLEISHQTVKNHMTSILRKLRVDDRTQAAVYALKHGWVKLDSVANPARA